MAKDVACLAFHSSRTPTTEAQADGSSWEKVIRGPRALGTKLVTAAHVTHSCTGGELVRTCAEKVKALIYVAAPAPDEGEALAGVFHRTKPKLARLDTEQRWSQLMARAQEGDCAAYKVLLREIVPFIRAIAMRRHTTEDLIDDVVQEVLISVHRVRNTYDPTRPFERWLAAIAERRSTDLFRLRMRRATVETTDPAAYQTFPDPKTNKEIEAITRDVVLRAIVDLPVRQREALEFLKLRELSLREAALISEGSTSTLKVIMHRALKTLRSRFGR